MNKISLQVLPYDLTVCKVASENQIDLSMPLCFVGKTDEEISLVCPTEYTPEETTAREDGWKAFRIIGVLDFSLIGILSRISTILAESGIGIFAVSTFNTDTILVKKENLEKALIALSQRDYEIL